MLYVASTTKNQSGVVARENFEYNESAALSLEAMVAKRRVHLSFPGKLKDEPLLWRVCERFALVFNIRQADYTEGLGWLMAELEGDGEQLEKGIRWLEEQGVIVAPIEQDVVQ